MCFKSRLLSPFWGTSRCRSGLTHPVSAESVDRGQLPTTPAVPHALEQAGEVPTMLRYLRDCGGGPNCGRGIATGRARPTCHCDRDPIEPGVDVGEVVVGAGELPAVALIAKRGAVSSGLSATRARGAAHRDRGSAPRVRRLPPPRPPTASLRACPTPRDRLSRSGIPNRTIGEAFVI